MATHCLKGLSIIVFAELLIMVSSSVCEDNRGVGRLISGTSINAINNFVYALRGINAFIVTGDTTMDRDNCRGSISRFLHQKGVLDDDDEMWSLHCWEPSAECTLIDHSEHNYLLLEPKQWMISLSSLVRTQINTFFLPIDGHNVISYTFLPYVTQTSIFFSTAMLTGCSVFIATPNNINCNIIVMHANRLCERIDPENDDNHKQAMFVLDQVHNTNQQCRYQIQRRWAYEVKRANIESHNYHYNDNIVYYRRISGDDFFYGYNLGGRDRRWRFCDKETGPSPRPEICNDIL